MAVKSGFFNSINNDRQYNAEDFGLMFEGVCSDGVLTTVGSLFEPTPGTGMSVNIGIGKGWFMKTWIYNDAPMSVEIDASDSLLGRIDAIVIDVDVSNLVRKDDILYVKGTAATHPDKPVMVNTATHKQYPICYITIPAGSTSINSANIENAISSGETPLCHAMLDLDENIQLGVRNGGTGKTSFTSGKVLVGNGTGAIQEKSIDATSGGTNGSSDLTTAGALYSTKTALQTAFQGGVDTIYNAVVAKGVTPSSSTPSAIATAIRNIPTGITPSGTKNITSNGTYDVTNYASANVNVSSGGTTWTCWIGAGVKVRGNNMTSGSANGQGSAEFDCRYIKSLSKGRFSGNNFQVEAIFVTIYDSSYHELLSIDIKNYSEGQAISVPSSARYGSLTVVCNATGSSEGFDINADQRLNIVYET